MELEQIIADINSTKPKIGFGDRLKKIRDIIEIDNEILSLASADLDNHTDHSNHSDWNGRIKNPALIRKLLLQKKVSEINGHTDHTDHSNY